MNFRDVDREGDSTFSAVSRFGLAALTVSLRTLPAQMAVSLRQRRVEGGAPLHAGWMTGIATMSVAPGSAPAWVRRVQSCPR